MLQMKKKFMTCLLGQCRNYMEIHKEDKKMSFIINILSTPAILVGLISLFGLILQKKPVEDVVKGTVKTISWILGTDSRFKFFADRVFK